MIFSEQYAAYVSSLESKMDQLIPQTNEQFGEDQFPEKLSTSMRYSLLAGGKRIRPILLLAASQMLGVSMDEAIVPACAVEMIHTYSLIHDDLPGMDDDDVRRGKPTSHKVFGIGHAILAGDGLLNFAYEAMLSHALQYPQNLQGHVLAMNHIAGRSGAKGMIAGQSIDLQCEHAGQIDPEALQYIHLHKTADLITAPLLAACSLASADADQIDALLAYGKNIGLAFQIEDDLLDTEGDVEALGKQTGMDAQRGKATWPALYGVDSSRAMMEEMWLCAEKSLDIFGEKAQFLREMITFLRKRSS